MSRSPLVCGGFLLALTLQASTILYDSTGQASESSDPIQSFGPLYDSFSTGANSGALSKLLLLLNGANTSPGSISVGLYADSSITPGALITSLGTVNDSSLTAGNSLIDVLLTANPNLSSGARYWIGLSGETTGMWSWTLDTSGIGVNGEYFSNSGGTYPNNPDGGYQMEVEIGAPPVPEPSTLFLGASALAALAMLRRRRAAN